MDEDSIAIFLVFIYFFIVIPLAILSSPDCKTAIFVMYMSILPLIFCVIFGEHGRKD